MTSVVVLESNLFAAIATDNLIQSVLWLGTDSRIRWCHNVWGGLIYNSQPTRGPTGGTEPLGQSLPDTGAGKGLFGSDWREIRWNTSLCFSFRHHQTSSPYGSYWGERSGICPSYVMEIILYVPHRSSVFSAIIRKKYGWIKGSSRWPYLVTISLTTVSTNWGWRGTPVIPR